MESWKVVFIAKCSHTDYGSITLLFQNDLPGLEVFHNDVWNPVPVIKDCILINIADALGFWTAGLLKSTRHRVVTVAEQLNADRFSIAYFCHANDHVLLQPMDSDLVRKYAKENNVKYGEAITAKEHLRQRLDATYLY